MMNNTLVSSSDVNKSYESDSTISAVAIDYMYVVPNSQFYGDLDQIIQTIKCTHDLNASREYILIGLENTVKNGYKLIKP